MPSRILVVEDDVRLAEMIGIVLREEGYEVFACYDGNEAMSAFQRHDPNLVLLDVMLPGKNGFEICSDIRQISDVPIIMLTARSETEDVVAGLEAGADDYIPKPHKPKELVARVRARLRNNAQAEEEQIALGELQIDVSGHRVERGGEEVALTPLEFDLLVALARAPWRVFSREELLEQVWGYRHAADTRLVNVHVQRLRSKIERDPENPSLIITVRGVGYRAGTGS